MVVGLLLSLALLVFGLSERESPGERADPPETPTFTDAVELGVAVFSTMLGAEDDEIQEHLESLGVEPWLAARLVVWLPVAFAERVLESMTILDEYSDGPVRRNMSDDPVFRAARRVAQAAAPEELLPIAHRSAQMSVARTIQASSPGMKLSEIEARSAMALTAPLPSLGPGHGGVVEPRAVFAAYLEGHGLAVEPTGTTAQRVGEMEIDALVVRIEVSNGVRAQVDFIVRHPRLEGGMVCESFVARGDTWDAAMREDALTKLERGTLHVLIASLVDPASCPDQVEWETWDLPSGPFRVCLGGQLLLWGAASTPLAELLDSLRDAIAEEPLSRRVHAIRVFAAREKERSLADEVLLDNTPWPAGEALCREHRWPIRDAPWATRVFMMLVPDDRTSAE